MSNYAVISEDGQTVANIIVAETKEIAEQYTGKTCISIPEDEIVNINATWNGESFTNPVFEVYEDNGDVVV